MAEAVVGTAVEVLLQNLISLSKEQISLVRDFEKDLKRLNESVSTIRKFLEDAEKKQVTDESVRHWLKKLEAVAFEADNVLDEANYQLLRKEMDKQIKMKGKVRSSFSCCIPFPRRLEMAHKIKDISIKLESINSDATKYELQKTLTSAPSDLPDQGVETDSFSTDPIFLGRENDVSRIVEMLTKASADEQVFSILPIVGMGGLGKTTVARKVYGLEKIKTNFEKRIWVHVSRNFDVKILFKDILASSTGTSVELGNREVLLKKLKEDLEAKKYLLVLDDVWNENRGKWDDFINSLSGISSKRGNGIIVTTRSVEVASIVKTLPFHHELKNLSKDDCWSIIKGKAFGQGDISSEFLSIGESITERCQGLPLAAKVVGGLLRGKSIDEWISIEKNWLSDVGDENTVSTILKLSFDHLLPPSLKRCFVYCSIFPKGFRLQRERLIELWMAEGFLQSDERNDMETMGNRYFDRLIQSSLLQSVEEDYYGNIIICNMHDLVHDLACSILSPKMANNSSDDIYQVRYSGLQSITDQSFPIPTEKARYLRTLFFNGKVSDIKFLDFKCLHVLILMGDDVEELSSSINELIHLRCLDISFTRIKFLPDSIGELYHLETVRAVKKEGRDYLQKLPDTLKYLINIRHLQIPRIELPPDMGQLTSLQTLPYFSVGDEKGCGIVELGRLKRLKGQLEIGNLEKVHDREEAMSACLFEKPNIFRLRLVWSDEDRIDETNDENVLEGLQPHPNLKSLKIDKFKGRRFPLWTSGLTNLIDISLSYCRECEEIPTLGHLPHLKSLYLERLYNVKSIGSSFYGFDKCRKLSNSNSEVCKEVITVFPALEKLKLSYMSNLTEWILPNASEKTQLCEVIVFPCLQYLSIYECPNLKSIPYLSADGQSQHCFTSLSHLSISFCKRLTNLPREMIESCAPSLENLDLSYLSSLTNMPMVLGCLQKMPRLTVLAITNVPKLFDSSMQVDITPLCGLQELEIGYKLGGSLMDDVSVKSSIVDGFLQGGVRYSLRSLILYGMEHWDSLPDQLQHLSALSYLKLSKFGIDALPEWLGNLSSLQTLFLRDCKNLRSLPSEKALQRLTKLTHLAISFCPVGDQIRIEIESGCGGSEWSKVSHIFWVDV